ncbi:MAG: hypothetical protein AB7O26_20470, partial [Planctomycetaceae bacterium]
MEIDFEIQTGILGLEVGSTAVAIARPPPGETELVHAKGTSMKHVIASLAVLLITLATAERLP